MYKIFGTLHTGLETTTVKLEETSSKILATLKKRKYRKAGFDSLFISTTDPVITTRHTIIYL